MKVDRVSCPVCSSRDVKEIIRRESQPYSIFWNGDGSIPELNVEISMCGSCGIVFQKSAYTTEDYERNFERIYNTYTLLSNDLRPFPSNDDYYQDALCVLTDCVELKKVTNVLEIGSNRGDFLYHIKSNCPHLNVLGLEPSSLPFVGVPTIKSFFDKNLFSNSFDLVIIRHVLEHIKRPKEFLCDIKEILTKQGLIFIEVPNFAQDMKEYAEIFIAEHVGYFTHTSMYRLLEEAGLYPIKENVERPNGIYFGVSPDVENANFSEINCEEDETSHLVEEFQRKVDDMIGQITAFADAGYEVVFYGFGNIFLCVHSALKMRLSSEQLNKYQMTILDDTKCKQGKYFKNIGVKSIDGLSEKQRYVFIICSMNRQHVRKMAERVKQFGKDPVVMLPWSGRI